MLLFHRAYAPLSLGRQRETGRTVAAALPNFV
jgi:hypothetical protein